MGTPNRSRFGVFKLAKPKRLKSRHALPDMISHGAFVYRALSELEVDGAWGTWLGEQRDDTGACQPVILKHTGESNRTRAGADALWLEALLTLKLDGPHVVPLVDYGVLDGRPFAVYAFEEGVFLAQVIEGLRERGRRLPSGVAVGIILQACELVRRLHRLSLDEGEAGGFVHGSLCPRNFLLTERGDVKVMGLIGVRPVGRVVGREHVPPAAMAYASPDLLGGAPVTPAVDVYSLAAILQELLGDGSSAEGEDELGRIVRDFLEQAPGGGFGNVDAFAAALQDAVRRTGTVVARQSIGAQVRGVCEQYLLERRRQVRALRETEWSDQKIRANAVSMQADGASNGASTEVNEPTPDELEAIRATAEDDEAVKLGAYREEVSDDAVTRIYDGDDLEPEGPSQPQAWMHDSRPAEAGRSVWSRWAVVSLLTVLVAVASGAAVMATRSAAQGPRELAVVAEVPAAKAATPPSAAARPTLDKSEPASGGAALAALEARSDSEVAPAALKPTVPAVEEKAAKEPEAPRAVETPSAERAPRRAPAVKAAPAPRRAAAKPAPVAPARAQQPAAEPATVAVADLPEAEEEAPAPPRENPRRPEPAAADGDLVIEEGAKVAYLSVDASPYATVFIDGEKKGVTPIVRMELPPGLHRMIARTEDGRTKRFTLQLEPGKTETVKLSWEE